MLLRPDHAEPAIPVLRKLVRENPLGILTTAIRSDIAPFIQSSHIPFVLDVKDEDSTEELGVLRGHIARQNPQSKVLIEAAKASKSSTPNVLEEEVLVLFTPPSHQHYVTPKFYTETKPSTGKVVPTWNYSAVQAYGRAKIYWDHKSDESIAFLSKQIADLSEHAETSVMGFTGKGDRQGSWKVSDAPERFIELLRTNIIGIEIQLDRLEGKFKMSQEMSLGDREGVVKGFANLGTETATVVSGLVKERSDLMESKS
ncbi:transcriptional regulator PAI 2-type [Xylaria bambusicola]|uniref:transcriptional regulator PAI 2-type n=1 Tax=Xylaria bambusicola TaxID=326684 RepID=UPI002007B2F2|nr:transcriptional regulator PAI 2-type [Xylaria bambusicola]KAI0528090.1 transcriptional regulator PAI 2-type [Xylaria bambusicola]